MLQYDLTENLLTPTPDDYMAQVTNIRSFADSEIADRMLHKGAGMTKSDILSVLELYNEAICDVIAEGNAVTTPMFNAFPSITGVFLGAADAFDVSRHKVRVNLNPGSAMRNAVGQIRTERTRVAEPLPYIVEVKDTLSGTVNDILTPGGVVQLRGSRLKLYESNPQNGVFLIDEHGAETHCAILVENKPGRIIVMLPATLAPGAYSIEVRSSYTTSLKETKAIKAGRFHRELTV